MSGPTNQIAAALANKASGFTPTYSVGLRSVWPAPPDKIDPAPALVIYSHKGTSSADSFERRIYTFPARVYVPRTADDARTQTIVNDLLDDLIVLYRSGLTLSGLVSSARIDSWDTNVFAEVDGSAYQIIDFNVAVHWNSGVANTA